MSKPCTPVCAENMPPDDAWVVVDDDAGAGSVGMREEHPLSYASIARLSKGEDEPAVDMSASVASLPPPRDEGVSHDEEVKVKEEEEEEEEEETPAVVAVDETAEAVGGSGGGGEGAAVEWVVETQPRKRRGKRRGKRKSKKAAGSATAAAAAAESNPFTLIAALEDSVVGAHTEEQHAPQRAPSPVAAGDVSAARKRRAKHSRATARATKGAPGRAASAPPSPPPALAHVALLLATHALTFFVGVYVGRREERALYL